MTTRLHCPDCGDNHLAEDCTENVGNQSASENLAEARKRLLTVLSMSFGAHNPTRDNQLIDDLIAAVLTAHPRCDCTRQLQDTTAATAHPTEEA